MTEPTNPDAVAQAKSALEALADSIESTGTASESPEEPHREVR